MAQQRPEHDVYRQEWRTCACGCGAQFWTAVGNVRERHYASRTCATRDGAARRVSPHRPPKPSHERVLRRL